MGCERLQDLHLPPVNRYSPSPLYQQIFDTVRVSIENGTLEPGDSLPTEAELMHCFQVSRYVVRQAVQALAQQGLIYTEHGRGSFVSHKPIEKPLDVLQSFHASMVSAGYQVEVEVKRKELVHPPINIAQNLGLKEQAQTFYLERVAYLDGKPINSMFSHIAHGPWEIDKLLDFPGGSLYQFLYENFRIRLVRSQSYIEIISAGEKETHLLNVPRGSILMQVSSLTCDKSGRKVEFSRVVYPGHRFRFRFDSTLQQDDKGNDLFVLS